METDQAPPTVERAGVTLVEGMHFTGEADGVRVDLDAGEDAGGSGAGARPMRLLLLSLAGCTAMDVLSILRKKRQQVSGLRVDVDGQRVAHHPRVYSQIALVYRVRGTNINPEAVARAIELSETRYCSVMAMINEVAAITSRYEIEEGA
ncbi:MAG TPA: OsmC family protein [Herpetosiphonaceae bacterium]|nr:OsmC family protein [Herpetosiphonaceae bacterium]